MSNFATKAQLLELMADMANKINVPTIGIGGGFAPIGTIISYMGTTAPQDYLICDGTAYSIADYKQLADFIETQFGSVNFFGGNGTTTFAVPDLRGEFLRGTGTNSHTDQGSGANVGVHQDGTEFPYINGYTSGTGAGQLEIAQMGAGNKDSNIGSKNIAYFKGSYTSSGGYPDFTSRPTNTSVLYCIKAIAAGDVYSTDERVVGTWIDGKPIYQKTVYIAALPNKTKGEYPHEIANVKRVINIHGVSASSNNWFGCIPNADGETSLFANLTNIQISTILDYSSRSAYVTLQYTKTTD